MTTTTTTFESRARECARDELFDIAPEDVADLQTRWALCSTVQEQIEHAGIAEEDIERALGKPASHSVAFAAKG